LSAEGRSLFSSGGNASDYIFAISDRSVGDIFVLLLRPGINRRRAQSGFRKRKIVTGRDKRPMVQRGAIMKLLSIIAAVMALVVASTTTMAEPKKPSLSNKATHRVKSPQPSNRVPTYEDRLREYYELKRQGWYKEDKA
jgi:hypothetical protein